MLLLLYNIKNSLYALDISHVIKVIPKVNLKEIPHTPGYVAGLFNYHGDIVPVIDLCSLFHGEPCTQCLGTRIILVSYPGVQNNMHILGLIAEGVTETWRVAENEVVSSEIIVEEAPYLGEIIKGKQEMIQIVQVSELLPESLKEFLFVKSKKR